MMAENLYVYVYVFTVFPFFSWWPFPLKLRSFFIPLSTVYVNFVVLWFLSRTSIFFSSTSQLDQVWHSSVHPDGQFGGDVKYRMNFSNVDTVFSLRSRWDLYARCPTLAAPHWKTSQSLVFNSSSSSLCFCAFFLLLPSLTLLVISSCRLENILGINLLNWLLPTGSLSN